MNPSPPQVRDQPDSTLLLSAPWSRLDYYERVDSTQTLAARRAATGEPLWGRVLWAERQTAGRGRRSRAWVSALGGLYVTLGLPHAMDWPPRRLGWLPLTAALSCVETLADLFGVDARVKWPNDVYLEGAKLGGFLGEVLTPPAGAGRPASAGDLYLMGMGLNWLNDLSILDGDGVPATHLGEHVSSLTLGDRETFLHQWLDRLARHQAGMIANHEAAIRELTAQVEAILWCRGRRVELEETEQGRQEGVLLGLGPDATARIERPDGSVVDVHCGRQAPGENE